MKICIYGAGAIGGYMGAQLALAGRTSVSSPAGPIWRRCRQTACGC
jgi:2-dehydropantoate 2-reductase